MQLSTKLEQNFARAFASREKELFLDTLLAHPDISLMQLASLAKSRSREIATQTTVKDLLGHAKAAGGSEKKSTISGSEYGVVSTRTAVDRRILDTKVLAFVKDCSSPCTATEVREALGGTPLQIRRALNRLIERDALSYQGQARGTRYMAN